jgi:gluconate 2-dehydrogenase alpha chain
MGAPYDPQTGAGAVGKNYCYQVGSGGSGFFERVTFHRYMGSGANGYSMDDFNADNFDHTNLGFIGGGVISCGASGARPIQNLPVPPGTPTWGAQWKAAIRKYYDRVISVGMQGESIAYRTHFLDLDPTYRDAWGQPLLRITFDWEDNERKMAAFGAAKIKDILQATGADTVAVNGQLPAHYDTAVYQSTHNTGGAIMGGDPATSVINNYCQMWDFANVFVVGASAFPQNAGRNPTGTVGALAYRAADGIVNKRVAT